MKSLTKLLIFVLCSILYTATAHADVSVRIGSNGARFYNQVPAACHIRRVYPDRVFARRIHRRNIRNTVAFNVNIRDTFFHRRHCNR